MDNESQNIPDFPDFPPEYDHLYAIDDDGEFESALAAYDGPGDKDYMRVTRKRIKDADAAYDLIEQASKHAQEALDLLASANRGTTRTRSLSLGMTNIEQGIHWIESVTYGVAPHDMDSTTPFFEIAERMNDN